MMRTATQGSTSAPVLSPGRRIGHAGIGLLWLAVNVRFWTFWLTPGHRGALLLYVPTTLALVYVTTVLPSLYWFYVGRMRRPVEHGVPPGRRVAMITLCVPSHEALEIIERQLRALPAVRYPHDSWVLDEGGDPRIRRLAEQHGVRYFTRRDVPRWNQAGPPFQARTKAGNVNAWLDHVADLGEDYEFFVQLDIDHLPKPPYLDRTLGHFDDPSVAWVQAPSVFGNLDRWTARGASEQDVVLQGPLQMGFYGLSGTPFIIGSHTTYRTAAIREIGGFQPTRAEDHLDTVVLAAAGYRGVYLPEVIAIGDGPEDFGTYLHQQFAWAYSMIQIFLERMPRMLRAYKPRQALGFLMAQSWYTLWSLSLASLWILPVVALLSDRPIARVAVTQFLAFHLAVIGTSTLMWWWTRRWFQPQHVLLSWRGVILEVARWPIVLWAVANVVLGIQRPYMITDKGNGERALPSAVGLYGPFFALALIGIGAIALWHTVVHSAQAEGYLGLVLINIAMALVLLTTVLSLELHDLRARSGTLSGALRSRLGVLLTLAVVSGGAIAVLIMAWAPLGQAIR